ncbi:AaceriAGL184Wp [[Ashbya] aceris (nom. inval.)]|nr:AaceriAGL184Wp [[Ashbya] aceris (nom. inval.)]
MTEVTKEDVTAAQLLTGPGGRGGARKGVEVDILDVEELRDWQRRKRTEFEDALKRNRLDVRQWLRYAAFESEQRDMRRARSVFERALAVAPGEVAVWLRYVDCELRARNVNHARNLLVRATALLPRVDKLWYKYVLVEESLGQVELVRGVYTKWCTLEPAPAVWDSFVDFETRQGQVEHVREVYSRYVMVHPRAATWLKWVAFERKHGDAGSVRRVYSLACDTLTAFAGAEVQDVEELVVSFAEWEATQQELERSRAVLSVAISRWPDSRTLKNAAAQLEKKFGGARAGESILFKRKREYEEHLLAAPSDYDAWWLYLDLIEESFPAELRAALADATVKAVPENLEKDMQWRKYINVWLRYLVYLETVLVDSDLTRNMYQKLVKEVIPNKKFTFAKAWIMYAEFEIRQENLDKARKILGMSLGMCPKPKLFQYYIDLEIKLKEFDRVRRLHEKLLEFQPDLISNWIEYAELEENLGDEERARGIYEIGLAGDSGLSQSGQLQLMQRYIQFETDASEFERARALYSRYVALSGHDPNVWISCALYESSVPTAAQVASYSQDQSNGGDEDSEETDEQEFELTEENKEQTRAIFEKALRYYANEKDDEGRILILQAYKDYESINGSAEAQQKIASRQPTKVTRKRTVDGIEKEYVAYEFPDDAASASSVASKFVSLAQKWKQQQMP